MTMNKKALELWNAGTRGDLMNALSAGFDAQDELTALRAQAETMRAALEAAPELMEARYLQSDTAYAAACTKWYYDARIPALAGTAPKSAANVTAQSKAEIMAIGVLSVIVNNVDKFTDGDTGGLRWHVVQQSRAALAQFEAGKAGQE